MIYVGFYTPRYADEARQLRESLGDWGLESAIYPILESGSWVRNCGQKPSILRQANADHPNRALVYVDADARIRRKPELFEALDCDFACHYREGVELLSGTLYFGPTAGARRLIDLWCEAQQAQPDMWDQHTLQSLVENNRSWLNMQYLPAAYCQIFDLMAHEGEPVIEHMQASRRLKT